MLPRGQWVCRGLSAVGGSNRRFRIKRGCSDDRLNPPRLSRFVSICRRSMQSGSPRLTISDLPSAVDTEVALKPETGTAEKLDLKANRPREGIDLPLPRYLVVDRPIGRDSGIRAVIEKGQCGCCVHVENQVIGNPRAAVLHTEVLRTHRLRGASVLADQQVLESRSRRQINPDVVLIQPAGI